MSAFTSKVMPSAFITSMRRSMMALLSLEIGNAEAEQSSNSLAAFEHGDVVAAAVQLVGCCQSGRTAAHYRHFLPLR